MRLPLLTLLTLALSLVLFPVKGWSNPLCAPGSPGCVGGTTGGFTTGGLTGGGTLPGPCTNFDIKQCTLGDPCKTATCVEYVDASHAKQAKCGPVTDLPDPESGLKTECNDRVCDSNQGGWVDKPLDGISCDDGDLCNGKEVCQAGSCQAGAKVVVPASTTCQTFSCDTATGLVVSKNKADGTPIADDGNVCTNDVCQGGKEIHPNKANGTILGVDGNACTQDICQNGKAYPAVSDGTKIADDGNLCTDDICKAGKPVHPVLSDGTLCSDGDACNGPEVCQSGLCKAGTPPVKPQDSLCTTYVCDKITGYVAQSKADGTPIADDGNSCTNDICQGGKETHPATADGTKIPDDGNPCTVDQCKGGKGVHEANDSLIPSDDGNECTNDLCVGGQAVHPNNNKILSSDNNVCTDDVCKDGVKYPTKADGTPIADDGNICTNDICQAGKEAHPAMADGTKIPDDGNPCTVDQCKGGKGVHEANDSLIPSDDGNECTNDLCVGGQAVHPNNNKILSSDNNVCTDDVCKDGVKYPTKADGTPIADDGNICTNDICQAGKEAHPAMADGTKIPDDGNPCTVDQCKGGKGVHEANDSLIPSDDGNECTNDLCVGGQAVHPNNNKILSSDNNVCTDDVCKDGVKYPTKADGTPIADDGNICTNDICQGGKESHPAVADGTVLGNTDSNICTQDRCINGQAQHEVILAEDDHDACTKDLCDPTFGMKHELIDKSEMDDNNDCTIDYCDKNNGVQHKAVGSNDGDACTVDTCDAQGGVKHGPVDTDDGDPCTLDSCDPATGVQHIAIADEACVAKPACTPIVCPAVVQADENGKAILACQINFNFEFADEFQYVQYKEGIFIDCNQDALFAQGDDIDGYTGQCQSHVTFISNQATQLNIQAYVRKSIIGQGPITFCPAAVTVMPPLPAFKEPPPPPPITPPTPVKDPQTPPKDSPIIPEPIADHKTDADPIVTAPVENPIPQDKIPTPVAQPVDTNPSSANPPSTDTPSAVVPEQKQNGQIVNVAKEQQHQEAMPSLVLPNLQVMICPEGWHEAIVSSGPNMGKRIPLDEACPDFPDELFKKGLDNLDPNVKALVNPMGAFVHDSDNKELLHQISQLTISAFDSYLKGADLPILGVSLPKGESQNGTLVLEDQLPSRTVLNKLLLRGQSSISVKDDGSILVPSISPAELAQLVPNQPQALALNATSPFGPADSIFTVVPVLGTEGGGRGGCSLMLESSVRSHQAVGEALQKMSWHDWIVSWFH